MNITRNDYQAVGLPRDGEEPVFEKPWQAQAFSLIVHLYQSGLFPWRDWVQVFSDEIKAAPAEPGESANDAYYRQWATALELMTARLGLAAVDEIARRAEQWKQAYLNTPHGQPVLLEHADCPPPTCHAHDHTTHRGPIAVSQAAG